MTSKETRAYLQGFAQAQLGNGKTEQQVRVNLEEQILTHGNLEIDPLAEMSKIINRAIKDAKQKRIPRKTSS